MRIANYTDRSGLGGLGLSSNDISDNEEKK